MAGYNSSIERTESKKFVSRGKKMPASLTIHLLEQKSAELSAEPDHTADSAGEDPFFLAG